jgi:glycosyltransferase involved in cell wall biosynthesis
VVFPLLAPAVKKTENDVTDARCRALFLIPTLTGGGAERVIVTIIRHLDRRRFVTMLAVVTTRDAAFIDDIPPDVEFIDLHSGRVRYVLPTLLRLIWKRRPDVVFSTLGHLNLALAILRPLLPDNVRYVARETVVISADLETKTWPRLWRAAYRIFYGRLDAVICQSLDMQKDLIQQFAMTPAKTVVINNPVDLIRIRKLAAAEQSQPPQRDGKSMHFVSAGRLTHQKGFDILIDAIALRADPSIQVTILGEGPLRQELEARAAVKGVAHQVRFIGFQKNPYPFFAQAGAFILSSRYEGFPNVVLEALACGTPVIALPAPGGIEEILSEVPGCIIARGINAESLAEAISRFRCGQSIDTSVTDRYSAETITQRYEEQLLVGGR